MTGAIGLDVGASKIAGVLFDHQSGDVVRSARVPTNPGRGGAAVLGDCVALVELLLAGRDVDPVDVPLGLGVCELVDPHGAITSAATFDWRATDLQAAFGGHPLAVESDVRAAAVSEARMGAGRAAGSSFVYVTVGTGIAFALVLDGTPYRGAHGNAMILGVPPVERWSSGAALARRTGVASAEELFGSAAGTEIVQQAAEHLGRAMAWLVNALDPELVVVGGGLGLRDDYRVAAATAMRTHIDADSARGIEVVPATLGPDAGAIGAALIAADRVEQRSAHAFGTWDDG